MTFSKYNSMKDIMDYPNMKEYLKIFYSDYLLDLYPDDLYKFPIAYQENVAKTPWSGEPFSVIADQLIDAVNLILDIFENKTRKLINLWNPNNTWTLEKNSGKDGVFLVAPTNNKQNDNKPAVIICPGGGYEAVCFSGEGTPIMKYMEAQGYVPFILKYRVKPTSFPEPQEDLSLAIQYVRANAKEYGINTDKIITLGASAGGHLCASQAALYDSTAKSANIQLENKEYAQKLKNISAKPNAVCLCYPVISFTNNQHEGSAYNLAGDNKELRQKLSVENIVTSDYPPTFVWTCLDDDCVPPCNAEFMKEALKKAHVKHELHMYKTGGHGCALAFSKSAHSWSQYMIEFMSKI